MANSVFFLSFYFRFIFISSTFRIGFLLVEYKIDKMIDEMNILWRYWEICSCSKSFSDQRWFRPHFSLGLYFERTLVWTMVGNSSGQWSGTCLIRGHFGLELVWSEAASSALRAHNDLRAHTRLIRGQFGLGRSDQRSHLSGTVWSEAISSATSTWAAILL